MSPLAVAATAVDARLKTQSVSGADVSDCEPFSSTLHDLLDQMYSIRAKTYRSPGVRGVRPEEGVTPECWQSEWPALLR